MKAFAEKMIRFFSGSFSEDDLRYLFRCFNSEQGHSEINKLLEDRWNSFLQGDPPEIDADKLLRNINRKIRNNQSAKRRQRTLRFLPYAALVVILMGAAFFFVYQKGVFSGSPFFTGQTTIMTENGQRTKIVLPDSSVAWLNSGTILSYNNQYAQDNRKVILDGQAFFQVETNTDIPFTVQCNELIVAVRGTRFDVNSYPETEMISVVLETGVVELKHRNISSFHYIMQPGEKASFDLNKKELSISHPNLETYSSWKDGLLVFRNESMKTVVEKLARWYNVDIEVTDDIIYQSIFTGTIQSESYEQIFRLIEFSCPVECRIIHNSDTEEIPRIIMTPH